MKVIEKDELDNLLKEKSDLWKNVDFKYIEAEFSFKDFKESINFVNKLADIAEEMNHHPDIFISYSKVKLQVFTHSKNAITSLDIELAKRAQELFLSLKK